jgi:hypothetical protein
LYILPSASVTNSIMPNNLFIINSTSAKCYYKA